MTTYPQQPSQSAEMLRRILIESSIKQEDAGDRTEQAVLAGQQIENADEVSAPGRITVGYSRNTVITDAMLSTAAARRHATMLAGSSALGTDSDCEMPPDLALSPHGLAEDDTDEADQNEMLGLNIDHDSSGDDLLTYLVVC